MIKNHDDGYTSFLPKVIIAAIAALALTACGGGTSKVGDANQSESQTPGTTEPSNAEQTPSPNGPYGDFAADGLLVKFRDSTAARSARSLSRAVGVTATTEFHIVNGLVHWVVPPENLSAALAQLQADPSVAYAEPNYVLTAFLTPNDPRFSQQYHLNNTGTPSADIDAPAAWDITTGTDVVVAVIDTGVDYNHPDLRDNIWTNTRETVNGRDDDGNGYIDDIRGWDFVNNDNNPMDDNRHGTHVAGIIAARGNNSTGVSGVNWSARIMPIKFLSATGSGSTARAISAIEYAVANGAKISNNSWGGGAASQALGDAISAAERAGHLFVAAAGNNNGNNNDVNPTFPSSYPNNNVISVAATTNTDALAGFSNIGARSVDVGAPGASILSTVTNNGYANLSGTSMAAPVVAGAAALVWAANPSLSSTQVKQAIMNNADQIPSLSNRVASNGRVNVARAVASVANTAPPPPVTPPTTPPVANVTVTPASRTAAAGSIVQYSATGGAAPYTWAIANPQVGTINQITGEFSAGTSGGSSTITATDANGAQGQTAVTVTAFSVTPATAQISVGQNLALSAAGGTAPYVWSSSGTAIATVNSATGVVTGVSGGTVRITANDANNLSATTGDITVSAAAATVTLTPQTAFLGTGSSVTFAPSGGSAPFTWQSTDPTVLSITSAGVATGQSPGTASVTVTDANATSASSGTITVRDIQVGLPDNAASLMVGDSLPVTVSGGRAPYLITSNSTDVASIDSAGNLVGVSAGTVIVTAKDEDGATGQSAAIRINTATSAIPISPASIDVPTGWWVRFTATGGAAPYSWSLVDLGATSAGTISATTGWFRASGNVGATANIRVEDATGAAAETGPITVLTAPMHR